jgi:hypothetical protein
MHIYVSKYAQQGSNVIMWSEIYNYQTSQYSAIGEKINGMPQAHQTIEVRQFTFNKKISIRPRRRKYFYQMPPIFSQDMYILTSE